MVFAGWMRDGYAAYRVDKQYVCSILEQTAWRDNRTGLDDLLATGKEWNLFPVRRDPLPLEVQMEMHRYGFIYVE